MTTVRLKKYNDTCDELDSSLSSARDSAHDLVDILQARVAFAESKLKDGETMPEGLEDQLDTAKQLLKSLDQATDLWIQV